MGSWARCSRAPEPSFFPRGWPAIKKTLLGVTTILDTLGTGFAYHLSHSAYRLASRPFSLSFATLGAIAFGGQVAIFTGATLWSWRLRQWTMHHLAASLLLFTAITSLHRDLAGYAELKRFDFVPLLLVLLLARALGELFPPRSKRPRRLVAVWAALALLVAGQTALGLKWGPAFRATYVATAPWDVVPHPEPMMYGREGQSWFEYFRRIRERSPNACRHGFTIGELADASWNFDLSGSLWSELPDHLAIGESAQIAAMRVARWRFPPRIMPVAQARAGHTAEGCAWVSAEAARLLAKPTPTRR
ncbi:MAG: hypothetical protein EXR72_14190 [Myxococcales bacterium]|nr:hypothetical protein [Myxococcales bacterium]